MAEDKNITHLIGIGGIGMSALAFLLHARGFKVTGSDLKVSELTERLAKMGINIFIGHKKENISAQVERIVISSAIPPENEELTEAHKRGLPVLHRAQLLAELIGNNKALLVTGSHGKSTTSAMLAFVLTKAGLDPTVALGAEFRALGGNARQGGGEYFVAEADESDGSFLRLKPYASIVTNIEADHLENYGSIDGLEDAVLNFISSVSPEGVAVIGIDTPYSFLCARKFSGNKITYSGCADKGADYWLEEIEDKGWHTSAKVFCRGTELGKIELRIPGEHNLVNALGVIALSSFLGVSFEEIKKALSLFEGIDRRFQLLGQKRDIIFIDDYAHHPTEIKATLKACRKITKNRIIAVFQPHRYTRTFFLYKDFAESFTDVDLLFLTDVYAAGEKVIEGVSSKLIKEAVEEKGYPPVIYEGDISKLVPLLQGELKAGDTLITLGAGDVNKIAFTLISELENEGKKVCWR